MHLKHSFLHYHVTKALFYSYIAFVYVEFYTDDKVTKEEIHALLIKIRGYKMS